MKMIRGKISMNGFRKRMISIAVMISVLSTTVSGAISCGKAVDDQHERADDTTNDTESIAASEPEETGRAAAKDSLPADLDLGGETIRIVSRNGDTDTAIEFYSDEATGDIVSDAVYDRNMKVSDRLGVQLEFIYQNENTRHTGFGDKIRQSVMADSDDYDIIANALYNTVPLIFDGLFLDLDTMKYLDFDQPWWNQSFLDITENNGRNYLAIGELSQTMISGSFAMFYNKHLFDELYPDEPTLYATVDAGKWTIDQMITYCSGVYNDLNGNSTPDEGDRFGHYFTGAKTLGSDSFLGGSGIHLVEENKDGSFTFGGTSDRAALYIEKMHKLLFEDNNTLRLAYNNEDIMKTMIADQTIFTTWMLSATDYLRDMKSDYGIIPMPKLDENQSEYSVFCHDGSSVFAIPSTCRKADAASAVLEAMAAETYRTVTPAYFEIALKTKYSRDDDTSRMLDIIVGSVKFDLAYIYGQELGTPIDRVRGILSSETECSKGFSTLASIETATIAKMEKVMEKFDKLN